MRRVTLLFLAASLFGCAAAKVSNVQQDASPGQTARPSAIYVQNFQIDENAIKQSSGMLGQVQQNAAEHPRLLGSLFGKKPVVGGPPTPEEAVDSLAQSITDGLNGKNLGVKAIHLQPGQPVPADGWIVSGQIVNVDPGNAARSASVGFGEGQSQVQVDVELAAMKNGTRAKLMSFEGGAESRKSPGGLVSKNPYAMAAKFVVNRDASEREVKQVGGEIATQIADFMTGKPSGGSAQ